MVADMFCNFYAVKNYIIANNWASTEAKETIHTDLGPYNLYIFDACLTKFKTDSTLINDSYLMKYSHFTCPE